MRQLRTITMVILGIGIFASGILAVERAVAQPGPARTLPRAVPSEASSLAERSFDVDWHLAPERQSVLGGCVYNRSGVLADKIRVGVEGLDANGAVIASTATWVGEVPGRSYGHFELPVLAGAAKYRIKVLAFDWSQEGR